MSPRRRALRWFDRLTLAGIALGLALELAPFVADGLRLGFFVALASVVLQIVAAHLQAGAAAGEA